MAGPTNPNTITFRAPTKFTAASGGGDIPLDAIEKYQYGFGRAAGTYTIIRDDSDFSETPEGLQFSPLSVAGDLALGQWYSAARAVTKEGKTSAWSNEASFVIEAKTPEAPTDFSIA